MPETWLIDKSALVRLPASPDAGKWLDRLDRGLVRVCTPTLLEIGFSARSADDLRSLLDEPPVSQCIRELLSPRIEARACEVQESLAAHGRHRAPSVPDLFVAACAEVNEFTLLHVDKDFDLIAEVTGQPVERLVTGQE